MQKRSQGEKKCRCKLLFLWFLRDGKKGYGRGFKQEAVVWQSEVPNLHKSEKRRSAPKNAAKREVTAMKTLVELLLQLISAMVLPYVGSDTM